VFLKHCYKYAPKYWVNWICRCLFIYHEFYLEFNKNQAVNDMEIQDIIKNSLNGALNKATISFIIKDSSYNTYIMKNKEIEKLNPSDDYLTKFDEVFQSFIIFLDGLDEDIQFNPTQIFALFYYLCYDSIINENILISHMRPFSKEGKEKLYRNMWESNTESNERKRYFKLCFEKIMSWKEYAEIVDDRPIPKQLRKMVWKKCKTGKCLICEEEEITENNFETGHIQARSLGGQGEINNLIPICYDCNRGMRTQNAYDYKRDVFPNKGTYEL